MYVKMVHITGQNTVIFLISDVFILCVFCKALKEMLKGEKFISHSSENISQIFYEHIRFLYPS